MVPATGIELVTYRLQGGETQHFCVLIAIP